ncbi:MAG: hypothetical protein MOB07_20190 [Acidobacteria bacterium]|nr:hypothetical protein [Acidobacteriota bacterium]
MNSIEYFPAELETDSLKEIEPGLTGVDLRTLAPLDTVGVHTCNSDYEIILLNPESGSALVQGGPFFARPREAIVNGSTYGACMLEPGWVGVGLRMVISAYEQPIITSPVQTITVERGVNALSLAATDAKSKDHQVC